MLTAQETHKLQQNTAIIDELCKHTGYTENGGTAKVNRNREYQVCSFGRKQRKTFNINLNESIYMKLRNRSSINKNVNKTYFAL